MMGKDFFTGIECGKAFQVIYLYFICPKKIILLL